MAAGGERGRESNFGLATSETDSRPLWLSSALLPAFAANGLVQLRAGPVGRRVAGHEPSRAGRVGAGAGRHVVPLEPAQGNAQVRVSGIDGSPSGVTGGAESPHGPGGAQVGGEGVH